VDGLYNHHFIGLLRADTSEHCARTLVNEAVKNSGRDNTTALVIRVA
jgi:serine/threonine protein phosphatase PrpC